jgi:hypothetical protein
MIFSTIPKGLMPTAAAQAAIELWKSGRWYKNNLKLPMDFIDFSFHRFSLQYSKSMTILSEVPEINQGRALRNLAAGMTRTLPVRMSSLPSRVH